MIAPDSPNCGRDDRDDLAEVGVALVSALLDGNRDGAMSMLISVDPRRLAVTLAGMATLFGQRSYGSEDAFRYALSAWSHERGFPKPVSD